MSMADVIKEVERLEGIAVAAHIDRANTGFEMRQHGYPNWKKDILLRSGLYGLEFDNAQHLVWYSPDDTDPQDGAERRKILHARIDATVRPRLAAVQDSDAHTSKALLDHFASKSFTKLKMNALTFDAFRMALIDPEARVRPQATLPFAFPRIIGMYCDGGFLDGEGIHFSANLNCFIGGRGTGKSTAIRTLAYAFGIDETFEEYENCPDLAVVYCEDANGVVYRYERQKGLPPTVKARDQGTIQDEVPADAFRIEYYQQGALAEVAKDPLGNPSLLQEFLDKHISLEDLQSREAGVLDELEQNSALLKPLEASASQLGAKQTLLNGLNAKLKAAETGKVKEIASLQSQLAAEKNLVKSLEEVRAFYGRGISMSNLVRNFDALASAAGTPTSDAQCKALLQEAKNAITKANILIGERQQEINAQLRLVGQQLTAALAALRERHGDLDQAIQTAIEILRKQGLAASINELNALIKQRDQCSSEVARIVGQQAELQELRATRTTLLSELAGIRDDITSRRKAQCAIINQNLSRTIPDYFVALFYDRAGITEDFCSLILSVMHGTYFPEESARSMCAPLSPSELADFVRKGNIKNISTAAQIDSKWATEIMARFRLIENLHRLEIVCKPALPIIKVLTKTTPQRTIPVKQLSDGQKHTILLTIAMLAESNVPLVIDQPEDDLDNAFIFSSVVATLRRIKETRQLIVVTHNANLAVLGDSELLLPLKRTGDKGTIYERGSIDRNETRSVVQEILEGGSLAFRRRKDIYGY